MFRFCECGLQLSDEAIPVQLRGGKAMGRPLDDEAIGRGTSSDDTGMLV
jgi:hypothetical protein